MRDIAKNRAEYRIRNLLNDNMLLVGIHAAQLKFNIMTICYIVAD